MRAIQLVCAVVLALGATAFATPAKAEDRHAVRSGVAEPTAQRRWYGWQTLTVDAVSIGLGVVAASHTESTTVNGYQRDCSGPTCSTGIAVVALTGVGGYLFGAPAVHWAHGHVGRGFERLGLNVGVPLVLGGLGVLVCSAPYSCDDGSAALGDWSMIIGFVVGAGIGTLGAPILDAALLAYEPASPEQAASRATRRAFSLRPDVRFTRERTALVGLRGSF